MANRYQIIEMDSDSGKWRFVAHGATYSAEESAAWLAEYGRNRPMRRILCGKDKT